MNQILIIIEIVLLVITVFSFFIAREFYISTKANGLRHSIIFLFICKMWVYGGAGIVYLIWPPDLRMLILVLILNGPMFFAMLELWGRIRTYNKIK